MESELKKEKMWKYDMHVHTREVSPCGRMSVEEVVNAYMESGYNHLSASLYKRFSDNPYIR